MKLYFFYSFPVTTTYLKLPLVFLVVNYLNAKFFVRDQILNHLQWKILNGKKKKITRLKPYEDVYIVTKGFYSLTVITSNYEAKHYNKVHVYTFIRCSELIVSQ